MSKKKVLRTAILISLPVLAMLPGCAHYPYAPPATYQLTSSWKYQIGPSDSVEIYVWRYPEVSKTLTVRPDGYINAPLVEDIHAAGKTPTELARDLEEQLSTYLRDPLVTVIVQNFVGVYPEQIRILGAGLTGGTSGGGYGGTSGGGYGGTSGGGYGGSTLRPLAVPYTDGMTLLDLMIKVGGISDYADGNRAVLYRFVEGVRKEYTLRLDDLLRNADLSANTDLRPGDIILIPESWF